MQGKSLAQKNKRGRAASKKPSVRTRRMLPEEKQGNAGQADAEARQAEKLAAAEARQAEKLAAAEAKQAARQTKLEARQAKKQARLAAIKAKADGALESIPAVQQASDHDLHSGRGPAAGAGREDPPEAPANKTNINLKAVIKYTLMLLMASAVLSVALLFALDLTGWRSAAREKVVGYLIAKEREVLKVQMTAEYDAKVDALVEQRLAGERRALAEEQQAGAAKETELSARGQELNLRQQQIDDAQARLDSELAAFEKQKSDFDAEKLAFETSRVELSKLADLYASMESENAADIIAAMKDAKLVVQIFSNMKKDDAAGILELMDAQKAADIISEMGE